MKAAALAFTMFFMLLLVFGLASVFKASGPSETNAVPHAHIHR